MSSTAPVAIVTGGSSGIGYAAAELLAGRGYRVAIVARKADRLSRAAAQIADAVAGAEVLQVAADVAEPQQVERLVEQVVERFGRIDAIVNAAGGGVLQPLEQTTYETWRQTIDSNLTSVVMITTAAWPIFQKQRSGVIVNVSSMSSVDPFRGFSLYAAAKVGVNMFTHCTADEGEAIGVRAVAVAPGAVETPLLRTIVSKHDLPTEKTLAPMQVAEVIRDCITGERQFESGETIFLASP